MPATVPAADTPVAKTDQPIGLWLFFVGTAALVVSLSQSILIPVLGELPQKLDTSVSNVQWLLTSTLLVAAVAVPLMGRLGDMFGKRRLLLVSVGSLVAGSLLTALTSNITLLIVGRAIQGLSAAAIPLGVSLLSALVPREKAGTAIATVSAMLGVGGALGLPLAALIAEHADFHVLFWITAAAGLLALAGIWALVPEDASRTGGRIDFVGTVLLGGALVSLLFPLSQATKWGWGSVEVVGLLGLSAALFVVFAVAQTRIAQPLVDLATLRRRPILLTNIASIFFGFALFASLIGTASYVQAPAATGYGFGSSVLTGGLAMLPSGLAMLILAPVSAKVAQRIGAPRTLAIGAVIVAVGWAARIVATDSLWQVIVGTTVVGAGTGIGYAAMPAIINAHTATNELAAANGLNTLVRSVGSSLASAVGGAIMAASTIALGGAEIPSLDAYRQLFAICAVASVLAAAIALAIPNIPAAKQPGH
ncbi:MFS transporter [Kineosporia mesophila]|uniref:MFS transporter n=1 Tax=Kineosporia mesophila TaxID=566012 RepID=A0ABP6ZNU5_9ACTN|nr:MFS transporter [Kineosporia mesophila]